MQNAPLSLIPAFIGKAPMLEAHGPQWQAE